MSEDNHNGEDTFAKDFDKCPVCGSTEIFYKSILNELQDRGLLDKKVKCFDFQLNQGIALPQQKIALLPFGSEVPGFNEIWDICCNCGMRFTTHLEKTKAKKTIDLAPPMLNRAERRRLN